MILENPTTVVKVPTIYPLLLGDKWKEAVVDPAWVSYVQDIQTYLDESYDVSLPGAAIPVSVSLKHQLAWGRIAIDKYAARVRPVIRGGSTTKKMIPLIKQCVSDALRYGNSTLIVTADGGVRVSNPLTSYARQNSYGKTFYHELVNDTVAMVVTEGEFSEFFVQGQAGSLPVDGIQTFSVFYNQDNLHGTGQSRITPAMRHSIRSASRTSLRREISSEFYAMPARVLNGVFSGIMGEELDGKLDELAMGLQKMLAIPVNEATGEKVSIEEFSAGDMSAYNRIFEQMARDVAAAANIDPTELGVGTSQSPSAESIYAAKEDLVLDILSWEEAIHETVLAFLYTAAEMFGEPDPSLTWRDPATPSRGVSADAFIKLAAVLPGLRYSPSALAQADLSEETIQELLSGPTPITLPEE
jgi:hypothetical protein